MNHSAKKHITLFLAFFVFTLFALTGINSTPAGSSIMVWQASDLVPATIKKYYMFIVSPRKQETKIINKRSKPVHNLYLGKNGSYLNRFFTKLQDLEKNKDSLVKIIHYGDSLLANDHLTIDLKKNFQKKFGDGGRGLVPITRGIRVVGRNVLQHRVTGNSRDFYWHAIDTHRGKRNGITNPALGFLGESFMPGFPGAVTSHRQDGKQMQPWNQIYLILRQKNIQKNSSDQTIELNVNHEAGSYNHDIELNKSTCFQERLSIPGSKKISIRFKKFPHNNLYIDALGLETSYGVAYTSVAHVSMETNDRLNISNRNYSCGMQLYQPDLIVLQFGVNESQHLWVFDYRLPSEFKDNIAKVVKRIKKYSPHAGILMVSPIERIRRGPGGKLITLPELLTIRQIQKEVAMEQGVAWFDSFTALGGVGSNQFFSRNGWLMKDRIHLTHAGGKVFADKLFSELMLAYNEFSGGNDHHLVQKLDREGNASGSNKQIEIIFNSASYGFFLIVALLIIMYLPRYSILKLVYLLLASYYFYASWNPSYLILILFSTVVDYTCALGIGRAQRVGKNGTLLLVVSIVLNLGLLFIFKYFHFMKSIIDSMHFNGGYLSLPVDYSLPFTWKYQNLSFSFANLLLPVGISFYTFQTMSYTIDVWKRVIPAENNLLRFALYVTFFPQLVAGPIVRAADFLTKLKNRVSHFSVNPLVFSAGVWLIMQGLFKKIFADWIAARIVDGVFYNPDLYGSIDILAGIYGYGIQIFGDFSGYSDIAIGSAMILGFTLTENFNRPYLSASITEFWRRWHISLGKWFMNYLYIPLGGNRKWIYRNLLITMFLCGLWHGAGWQFIIWGVFHGMLLAFERITGTAKSPQSRFWQFLRIGITFHIVLFGWVIFRSSNLDNFFSIFRALFHNTGSFTTEPLVFVMIGFSYITCFLPYLVFKKIRRIWLACPAIVQGVIGSLVMLLLYNLSIEDAKPFIYFQF